MAGDKVLSGDCRFARRNYFPDARKEIVARVSMARGASADGALAMETRNEFLHGTFLPPPPSALSAMPPLPPSFSLRLLPPFRRLASPPPSSSTLPPPSLPQLRCDSSSSRCLETRGGLGLSSFSLGESGRASFNEKLISRVSRRLSASESRISSSFFFFYLLRALVSPAVSDLAVSLFSVSLSAFSFHPARPFRLRETRAIRASSFLPPLLPSPSSFPSVSSCPGASFQCSSRVFTADASYARLHPPLFS